MVATNLHSTSRVIDCCSVATLGERRGDGLSLFHHVFIILGRGFTTGEIRSLVEFQVLKQLMDSLGGETLHRCVSPSLLERPERQ